MDRKPWTKTIQGTITEETDANDYYYHWIQFETEDVDITSLEDLFEAANLNEEHVTIKIRKHALFIYKTPKQEDKK